MSKLTMPQLAQEMAESNRRAADAVPLGSWRTETPQDAPATRRRAIRSARQLTRFTLGRKSDARIVWDSVVEVVQEGAATEDLREMVQLALVGMNNWLRLA